ncbi:hypothetical protein LTR66_009787 [Elasticomyces elasticus]|nr:hypothetical protein LTR66_009787 [Elasticomyces elasticus]
MSPEELMKKDEQDGTNEQEALIPIPVPVHVLVGEDQPTTELPAATEVDNADAAERRAQEIVMAHDDKQAHDVGSTLTEPSPLADNHERPPSPNPPPPDWLLTWPEKASQEGLQMRESVLESNEGYDEANAPSTCHDSSTVDDESAIALYEGMSIEPRLDLADHGEELLQSLPSHENPSTSGYQENMTDIPTPMTSPFGGHSHTSAQATTAPRPLQPTRGPYGPDTREPWSRITPTPFEAGTRRQEVMEHVDTPTSRRAGLGNWRGSRQIPDLRVEAGRVVLIVDEVAGLTEVAEVAEGATGAKEVAAFAGVVVGVVVVEMLVITAIVEETLRLKSRVCVRWI